MFGVDDGVFLSKGIKIVDGIAGAGKSSIIDDFFRSRNIPYARFTSTNRLKRDASDRYNMKVQTIAAGLFVNRGTHFYIEQKDPDCENVVIDEILQSDPKAIQWCIDHADTYNIIITTDSKQLLSPENEAAMVEAFTKLRMSKDVVYVTVGETLRARDKKTNKLYHQFYGIADRFMLFDVPSLTQTFPNVIKYEDMPYSPTDSYITHDNATEDFLYKEKSFNTNPLLDLIPKGCIASKPPKDLTAYPLLSQLQAQKTHATSYTQVLNVGTPVRFQGSEVKAGDKLYFLVQPDSMVSARELYTVITRMWTIDSFVIVVVNTPGAYDIHTFRGLPVKTHKYLYVNEDGYKALTTQQMNKMLNDNYDTDEIYYDRDQVRNHRGQIIYQRIGAPSCDTNIKPGTSTAGSLARRDSKLNYTYMDEVYRILDEHNIDKIRGIHKLGSHTESEYELDLFSAHPTILKYDKMPIDGMLMTDHPHDNMLNFYHLISTREPGDGEHHMFTKDCIVTDDMKNHLEKYYDGQFEYLFSTPYSIGCYPGDALYKKAHDTQESKKKIKEIHYGYYQKPYIKLAPDKSCYIKDEAHIYELLICQVFSQLTYYMLKLYENLNGTAIVVDAVKFPCYNDDVKKSIAAILPDFFDYRIRKNDAEKTVLFQTYDTLLTRKEKRAAAQRARRQKQKEELEALRLKSKGV